MTKTGNHQIIKLSDKIGFELFFCNFFGAAKKLRSKICFFYSLNYKNQKTIKVLVENSTFSTRFFIYQ